jgi:23S rRNA (uracil1939-C5)-methyltransferase
MSNSITLQLTTMANGGSAMGYDNKDRPVFVPYTIPGETVLVEIEEQKAHFARAHLLDILEPSPSRITPRCPHFSTCSGCHFQHIDYKAQVALLPQITADQLKRIGGFEDVTVPDAIPHDPIWQHQAEVHLSPVAGGGLGFWSSKEQQIINIDECPIIREELLNLWQDVDLELPGLRKLTLRVGDDDALLAVLEIDDVEPPELEADFPVSVAIVLPNRTAASLVGDSYSVQTINERDFRVSPGCYFAPNAGMRTAVITTLLSLANFQGTETLLEGYSGVGTLTAFLAEQVREVVAIEINEDAVNDAMVNLDHTENVSLYQGWLEDVLPTLDIQPDVIVVDPPAKGLSPTAVDHIIARAAPKLLYVSADIATLARDGKRLAKAGYQLTQIQPFDTSPHTYHFHTVSLWQYEP